MKMICRLRKHHYIARTGVFLAVLALVVVGVSCSCTAATEYDLTVEVAPDGSGSATDLINDSPYATGTKVVLQADAAAGYQFVNWSAPAGIFADINAVQTTFTMPAQDVTITAYFVKVHSLTMAADPVGGGTATDLTSASPYPAGTVVSIEAAANELYQFANWSATAGTFADANGAETTFTMPDQDVTVTAHFVLPTPFTCYLVDDSTAPYVGEVVYLEDEFGAVNATVESAVLFGNPAEQTYDGATMPILNIDHQFTAYGLTYEGEPGEWLVEVNNQFGTQELVVSGPVGLAVPTQQAGHEPPVGLDHYLLYGVIDGPSMEVVVGLNDQFGYQPEVSVYYPIIFASPVRKTHGDEIAEIMNPEAYGVVYLIDVGYFEEEVQVVNQFGEQSLDMYGPVLLAVPSEKKKLEPEHPLAAAAVLGDYNYQLIRLLWANNISAEARGWDVIAGMGDYDVVIVNEPDDPGSADFHAFLDAASDNGVAVVFTSSYATDWSWGISLLEWYSGEPAGQDVDYYSGDVYYKVTQEHPIFEGWDVGDEIAVITGGDCDHTWFWDYSGDTIAEVGSADLGVRGDGVAVGTYGASTHVLLASLGPQSDTDVTAWTDDGKAIFINAVRFAAGIS